MTVTSEQMAMISADPGGDARLGRDRRNPRPGQRDLGLHRRRHDHRADNRGVPTVTAAGVRAAAAYGAALAREELLPIPQSR